MAIGPRTQEVLIGDIVNGWHMTAMERKVVTILLQRKVTRRQLADALYAYDDDPPLYADRIADILLCRLRKDFGDVAFPRAVRALGGIVQFDRNALEAALSVPGQRSRNERRPAARRAVAAKKNAFRKARRERMAKERRRKLAQAAQAMEIHQRIQNALTLANALRTRRAAALKAVA